MKESLAHLSERKRHELARKRKLDPAEEKRIAQDTLDEVFTNAKPFYGLFKHALEKEWNKEAAFNLHQAAECFYSTVLLVYTNYKPKTHDLDTLRRLAPNHDPAFFTVFP
ncbi:MAG TPA: HEPN domain-containing protein, partial [Sedimentisphaerales bacterium]|nr:HEPN domain-containing protein [Sedimentisphaerales bacterium]